jgi:hypothetical protein
MNLQPTAPWSYVQVCFMSDGAREWGDKEYTYRTREVYEPGDYAVVNVNGVFKVVHVTSFTPFNPSNIRDSKKLKWIVCRVDVEAYTRREEEEEAVAKELEELTAEAKRRAAVKAFRDAFEGEPELQARFDALMVRQSDL